MRLGDLTFGKTLGIIKAEYSEWISFIGVVFKAGKRMAAAKYFPHLTPLLAPLLRRSKEYKALVSFTEKNGAMVTERMSIETDRKDFMFYALKAMQKGDSATAMSVEEIKATFEVLMVAGSETTATLLSGVTYVWFCCSPAMKTVSNIS
jgi:cytochrome P450